MFYYFSASKIWPNKRLAFGGKGLIRGGLFNWGVMVFNATFNNISVILWLAVLLVEEIEVSGENHRPAACH